MVAAFIFAPGSNHCTTAVHRRDGGGEPGLADGVVHFSPEPGESVDEALERIYKLPSSCTDVVYATAHSVRGGNPIQQAVAMRLSGNRKVPLMGNPTPKNSNGDDIPKDFLWGW